VGGAVKGWGSTEQELQSTEACLLLSFLQDSRSCWARKESVIIDLAKILRKLASKKFLC